MTNGTDNRNEGMESTTNLQRQGFRERIRENYPRASRAVVNLYNRTAAYFNRHTLLTEFLTWNYERQHPVRTGSLIWGIEIWSLDSYFRGDISGLYAGLWILPIPAYSVWRAYRRHREFRRAERDREQRREIKAKAGRKRVEKRDKYMTELETKLQETKELWNVYRKEIEELRKKTEETDKLKAEYERKFHELETNKG